MIDSNEYIQSVGEPMSAVRWLRPSTMSTRAERFVTLNESTSGKAYVRLWKVIDEPDVDHRLVNIGNVQLNHVASAVSCISDSCVVVGDMESNVHVICVGVDNLDIKHTYNTPNAAPANAISAWTDSDIVIGGDDGCVSVVDICQPTVKCTLPLGSSVIDLCHSNANMIVATSLAGLIQLVDTRLCVKDCIVTSRNPWGAIVCSATAVTVHPTLSHVVLCGNNTGTMAVTDFRMAHASLSNTTLHTSYITQLGIHPTYTDHLFSASCDGSLLHVHVSHLSDDGIVWTGGDTVLDRAKITNIVEEQTLPVVSFDLSSTNVIAATDRQTLCLVSDLILA